MYVRVNLCVCACVCVCVLGRREKNSIVQISKSIRVGRRKVEKRGWLDPGSDLHGHRSVLSGVTVCLREPTDVLVLRVGHGVAGLADGRGRRR